MCMLGDIANKSAVRSSDRGYEAASSRLPALQDLLMRWFEFSLSHSNIL